jgi:hypothetical protein
VGRLCNFAPPTRPIDCGGPSISSNIDCAGVTAGVEKGVTVGVLAGVALAETAAEVLPVRDSEDDFPPRRVLEARL